jgi:hypothetical protein
MNAITFRIAPIPAWQLAEGDHILTAPDTVGFVCAVDSDGDRIVVHTADGGPYPFDAHDPVRVKAPSGPDPADGGVTWWRTPNEYSPCTCLHRLSAEDVWEPAGLDDGCREHAGADQWEG